MTKGLAFAVALAVAGPALADFQDALSAYDAGDYETAYEEWHALAQEGDAEAEAALAGMHLVGAGVAQDFGKAAQWYRRAAKQGHAVARLNLGDLYSTGRGVPRDYVQAYLWLGLAAAQGSAWADRRRAEISWNMTLAQIAEAEDLIRAWQARAK